MSLTRRTFIRSLGSGLLVAAAAPAVAQVEPLRRFWQVSRSAPVGAKGPLLDGMAAAMAEVQNRMQRALHETFGGQRLADVSPEAMRQLMIKELEKIDGRELNQIAEAADRERHARGLLVLDPEMHVARSGNLIVGVCKGQALKLETGDDVRRVLGSGYENIARDLDERAPVTAHIAVGTPMPSSGKHVLYIGDERIDIDVPERATRTEIELAMVDALEKRLGTEQASALLGFRL